MPSNKISAAIICKNESATLEKCLQSIRPFVDELVIVDTGSTDNSPEIAKKYCDRWEHFIDCNDANGNIEDFSMARQRSFDLASNSTVIWLDGDDELLGGENIRKYVEQYKDLDQPYFIQCPYEYAYDENGKCTLRHYRERIIFNKDYFKWTGGVHEVVIPKNNVIASCETVEDIVWKHNRQFVNKVIQPNRNLRILKAWYEKHGDSDARQLYYLGLEYGNVGDLVNSRKMLNRYLELSGWEDDMGLQRLMDYDFYENNYKAALDRAMQAIKIKENWCEAYFYAAKACYFLANNGVEPEKNWNKCINFINIGLSLPPTQTLLFINPKERNIEIHRYLSFALAKLGRVKEALDSIETGLKSDPTHQELLANKKVYQNHLDLEALQNSVNRLVDNQGISAEKRELIHKVIANKPISDPVKTEMQWKPYKRNENYPSDFSLEDQPVAETTPHSQAWGIPEGYVIDDLPLKMTNEQLQSMVICIWKEYMLHDELVSAISFLEKAPNRVRHSNITEQLLTKTKKMIAWIDNEEEYDIGNSARDNNGNLLNTDMTPLTQEISGSAYMRYKWMLDRLPQDKTVPICVFACVDGQESNRFGLLGYKKVIGVDCCSNSIKIANEKAKEFNTGAVHIKSYFNTFPEKTDDKFDVVCAGDIYEHLLNPVEDLLVPAKKIVNENGRMLITTPYGSWTRGIINKGMHPWLWSNEGKDWLCENHRCHVIAPTVWTTAKHFEEAGWYVKECNNVPQWYPLVQGQGNICVEALVKAPYNKNTKDIVLYMGDGLETITPHSIDLTGIGGSELALREMSNQLVQMGHKVRVYAGCGRDGEGIYNGVAWYESSKFHDLECDILIISRQAQVLDDRFNVKAKLNVLWVHDLCPKGFTEEINKKTDIIFALSEFHKKYILSNYNYLSPDKVIVSGNGINFDRFDKQKNNVNRNPHKMIVSSSPDRYLAVLLKIFPRVKEQVPDATLSITYGFFNWKESAKLQGDQGQLKLIEELEKQIKQMEPMGIKMLGRLNQWDLAREFLSSGTLTLSNWFMETNCISLSEAYAAGCNVVCSNNGALSERVNEFGTKIDGDWLSQEYQDKFVEATVKALKSTTEDQRQKAQKFARENLSWEKFANQWNDLFLERFDENKKVIDKPVKVFKLKKYEPLMDRA